MLRDLRWPDGRPFRFKDLEAAWEQAEQRIKEATLRSGRLEELIRKYLRQEITPQERQELEHLVESDPPPPS